MKEKISCTEINRYTKVMLVFLGLMAMSVGPSLFLVGAVGLVIPLVLWLVAMWAALKIEKIKKAENVQTYKEIVAFMEDRDVEEARLQRNPRWDKFHKGLIVIVVMCVFAVLAAVCTLPFLF